MATASCGHLYQIRTNERHLDGIPFYVQSGGCIHETVYLETIYDVALQVVPESEKAPPIVLAARTIPQSVYLSSEFESLRNAVAVGSEEPDAFLGRIGKLAPYNPATPDMPLRISNVIMPAAFVDYRTVHYINIGRPWIGTASATAKLSPNGTLAEGTASIESKTTDALLGSLPAKELILAATGVPAGKSTSLKLNIPGPPRPLQLAVTPRQFSYTLWKTIAMDAPFCHPKPPIAWGDPSANLRREAVAGAQPR